MSADRKKREGSLWNFLFPPSAAKASAVRARSACQGEALAATNLPMTPPGKCGVTIYGRYFTSFGKGRSTLPQREWEGWQHCPVDPKWAFHYRGPRCQLRSQEGGGGKEVNILKECNGFVSTLQDEDLNAWTRLRWHHRLRRVHVNAVFRKLVCSFSMTHKIQT